MIQSVAGILALLGVAWLVSENRRIVPWRMILAGLGLQVAIAMLMLKAPLFREIFLGLNTVVMAFEEATQAGTSFVFGYLGGAPLETGSRPLKLPARILIGGLGSLCPERRSEIVDLGAKALLAGVLASLMTGAVVGALYAVQLRF